jgi:hypothetical protein
MPRRIAHFGPVGNPTSCQARSSFPAPEDDDGGEGDGTEEGGGASVVAGGDAAPVRAAGEGDLDAVALALERLVVGDRLLAALLRRDAGDDAALGESGAERVAVMAAIGDQFARRRQQREEDLRALLIVPLPGREHRDNGAAVAVADGVQLGVQPAPGAAEAAIERPLLRRLAAVRCAL